MFFRRAREDRAFREAQRAGYELFLQQQAMQPWPDFPEQTALAPAVEEPVAADFLPSDLRVPSRQEVAGLMMRWLQPLVLHPFVLPVPGGPAWSVRPLRRPPRGSHAPSHHNRPSPHALAVLALTGCSINSADPIDAASSATVSVHSDGESGPAPLSSAALADRLLDESDLGEGYSRTPRRPAQHDDVTVIGCPPLEKLGGEAAVGGSLDFSHKAKVSFTYAGGPGSEVAEELYSDTAANLSKSVGEIFDAMVSCPTYPVVSGSVVIDMGTHTSAAPALGDERWSQLLTFSVGGQRSVVKQTAVRIGNVLVIVSGSPGLVDANLEKALAKAAH